MEGKLASCFKVKITPVKKKSKERAKKNTGPDENSPDPKMELQNN